MKKLDLKLELCKALHAEDMKVKILMSEISLEDSKESLALANELEEDATNREDITQMRLDYYIKLRNESQLYLLVEEVKRSQNVICDILLKKGELVKLEEGQVIVYTDDNKPVTTLIENVVYVSGIYRICDSESNANGVAMKLSNARYGKDAKEYMFKLYRYE